MGNRPWSILHDTATPTDLRYPQAPIQEFRRVAANGKLIEFCQEPLSNYKVPRLIEFRESRPQLTVGTLSRKAFGDQESME